MGYVRPTSLTDALTCLASGNTQIAAGCTDLFPATGYQQLTENIIDITAIPELRGITTDGDFTRIAAATTWSDLLHADLAPGFQHLKLAAREVGSVQIQNAATIGGNLCNASPAADGVPPLLTLDAQVELRSQTASRTLPLAEFITGPRRTRLQPGELLTALLIPKASAQGHSTFIKLGARKYLVISIAMVAARIVQIEGRITEAAVAIGSCSAVATRLSGVEAELNGRVASPQLAAGITPNAVQQHIAPISDGRGDAAYRNLAAVELVRRAVGMLVADVQGEAA